MSLTDCTPRAAAPATDCGAPFISVLVPVRNEARFIKHTLEQLLTQDYDRARYEVVVVDGCSTDGTPEIVRSLQATFPHLRLYHNPRRLSSAARNIGVRHAQGELLVVVDGHCELSNARYLRDLADAFVRSGADCIGRPQPLDVPGTTPLQAAIAAARASWLGHHPASEVYSGQEAFVAPQSVAVAYRRTVFERVGLFDESFDACEDVEFNHRVDRAGLRCLLSPNARVFYHPRSTLLGLFRQMMRYGRGRLRLLRKHWNTFSVGSLAPAGLLTAVLLAPVLLQLLPPAGYALMVAVLCYFIAVLYTSISLAYQARDARLLPRLPVVFCIIHGGAGVGLLLETLIGLFPRSLAASCAGETAHSRADKNCEG